MPITLSRNEFITAYYKYAWEVADITIASTEKQNGPINSAIDVESVKAEGVMAGLDKTFEKYDPEHSSGARVKTLLSKIVRNSVLSELGKATTDAKRARLIATKPSAKKGEEWKYSCITPGVRQHQSASGPFEYMESVGWQERKEEVLQLITKYMKHLPDHDMIILANWLQDESTYVEVSLDELGKEHTPANANWVYQRKNKAIKALKKIMGGTKPDYRDISLEPAAMNANIMVKTNFDVIRPDRESAVPEHSSKYNYHDVVTQLVERLSPGFNLQSSGPAMAGQFELLIPEEDLKKLEDLDVIGHASAAEGPQNACGGVNRALSWIARCNCAILSGWRKGNPRKVNDENNRTILLTLREKGYGLCRCRGCYPESGQTVTVENSFFVFDRNHTGEDFFKCIRSLAQTFEQDSFLFIEAYGGKRYLFGTNEFFGIGKKEYLGPLHIGAMETECFTRFGNKEITFREKQSS